MFDNPLFLNLRTILKRDEGSCLLFIILEKKRSNGLILQYLGDLYGIILVNLQELQRYL